MRNWLVFIMFILIQTVCWGTHNRAGEITYEQTGPETFKIKLITYTRVQSDADRPFILVNWGDGSIDSIPRSTGYPQAVDSDIEINLYEYSHTFPGPGVFVISMEDPNRNEDILNIPNSVNTPFYIASEIIINPFLGNNNSPSLLNPPIESACLNATFLHNPSAYDSDGDSLSYQLVDARGLDGDVIDGYYIPNNVSIDPSNGTLIWNTPTVQGEFNFAILINEYRNGIKIGSVIRDMQVTVKGCSNHPPVIDPLENICIAAGNRINTTVTATDVDPNEVIFLSATGGPLTQVSGTRATFPAGLQQIDTVRGIFNWDTECIHVRALPYQVNFKAEDNDNQVQLIDLASLYITVVAPAVENLAAKKTLNGIEISWDPPICNNAIGYKIYRKIDGLNWKHDTCELGVPTYTGFELIDNLNDINLNAYTDNNVIPGNRYCYRIVSYFADGAISYSSEEICSEPLSIYPIPTHVDVTVTDPVTGEIYIQWSNPNELDSLEDSGPFFYKLLRNNEVIYTTSNITDTSFTDSSIDTKNEAYSYTIELHSANEGLISTSYPSQSQFLKIDATDQLLSLNWTANVPWENDSFIVYRETFSGSGLFEAIDTVYESNYIDQGLQNGTTYCYFIASFGGYHSTIWEGPFVNRSQIQCSVPLDTIPPCPPNFNVISNCVNFENTLMWNLIRDNCDKDIETIEIYASYSENEEQTKIYSTENLNDSILILSNLRSVAGCYSIVGIDSNGNASKLIIDTCLTNCPVYTLPNVFSPNGDDINDLFKPIDMRYIDRINIKIYNRWGNLLFETDDPEINWDGRNDLFNLMSSSGVYFYRCEVYPISYHSIKPQLINGFFHLVKK